VRKALEWGALWVREWRDGITHVVVDNGLSYQDVLKFLKLDKLPVRFSESRCKCLCTEEYSLMSSS